jgi:hypothetical protein
MMAGLEFRLISTEVGQYLKQPTPNDRAVEPCEDVAAILAEIARKRGGKIRRLHLVSHA